MTKQNQDNNVYAWIVLIGLAFLSGAIFIAVVQKDAYINDGKNITYHNQTFIDSIVNQTLSNNTLMTEVTNNINLYYIQRFDAIPIYYQNKLYQCNNISEVKQ